MFLHMYRSIPLLYTQNIHDAFHMLNSLRRGWRERERAREREIDIYIYIYTVKNKVRMRFWIRVMVARLAPAHGSRILTEGSPVNMQPHRMR